MQKSIFLFLSTAAITGVVHADYYQDFSGSQGSSFTDQNNGKASEARNYNNWQNPNNNWGEKNYNGLNNGNYWSENEEDQNDQATPGKDNSRKMTPNTSSPNTMNPKTMTPTPQGTSNSQNPTSSNAKSKTNNSYKGAVSFNESQNPQKSYDSRPAPSNFENSQNDSNSVWNKYYDNGNQAPQPAATSKAQNRNVPQNTPTQTAPGSINTNSSTPQWDISLDDSTQSQSQKSSFDSRNPPTTFSNSNSQSVWGSQKNNSSNPNSTNKNNQNSNSNTNSNSNANSSSSQKNFVSVDDSSQIKSDNTPSNSTNGTMSKDTKGNNGDLNVTRAIQLALVKDKSLSTLAQHVIVMTNNGQVYLRGNVNNDDEKAKVEAVVKKIDGVKSVDNQVNVLNITSQ